MKAIILNSGLGKRMGEFTKTNHKSMARLYNDETIFSRQLRILIECGVKDFIITTGQFHEQLEKEAEQFINNDVNIEFVFNPVSDKTNYIYSIHLAKELINDDCLLLHGDLVFDKEYIEKVMSSKLPDLGSVNRNIPLPEKDFKALVEDNKVKKVAIDIFEDCVAFQPLYKLSKLTMLKWMNEINKFVDEGTTGVYAENALNNLLGDLNVIPFSYHENFVDEVDNLDDLKRVNNAIVNFDKKKQKLFKTDDLLTMFTSIKEQNNLKKSLLVASSRDYSEITRKFKLGLDNYVVFSGYSSNPKLEEVVECTKLYLSENCDNIIALGGGSAIDVSKATKALLSTEDYSVSKMIKNDFNGNSICLTAIPTTAGSGSESTKFAVIYVNGSKYSIDDSNLLPDYAILNHNLLGSLPDYQKKSTLMDAYCQCIESMWSINSTEESIEYSKLGLSLLVDNMKNYMENSNSYNEIMNASNLSGRAINISKTTAVHAMSYKLSQLYDISHGHAVIILLPLMMEEMLDISNESSELNDKFKNTMDYMCSLYQCNSYTDLIEKIYTMINSLDLEQHVVLDEDVDLLVSSVNVSRLNNNPVLINKNSLYNIYKKLSKTKKVL